MIKRLNDVSPAVKRPMRVGDLQDVWDGLSNALASDTAPTSTGPLVRIVSGFYLKSDGNLSAGTVAFNGNLYFHPDIDGFRILVGDTVYASEAASGDSRVFADGTTQVFSFNRLATTTAGGQQIGVFTQAFITDNRTGGVPDGSIGTSKLADNSVTQAKLSFAPFVATATMVYNGTAWSLSDFIVTDMGSKRPITAVISPNSSASMPYIELQSVSYIASASIYNTQVSAGDTAIVLVTSSSVLPASAGIRIGSVAPVTGSYYRIIIHGYQA